MAVQKSTLRLTEREAAFKVYGSAGSVTLALDTDLLRTANQVIDSNIPRQATITQLLWSGDPGVIIDVVRNNVLIATLQCDFPNRLAFGENFTDNVEQGSDVTVTIRGGSASTKNGQLWISLSKVAGYKQKFEPAEFGYYDNPTVSGA